MQFESLEIIRPLGNSTKRKFNAVYLVRSKECGTHYVLKLFDKTAKSSFFEALFRQESQLIFDHPSLPKVEHLWEDEERIAVLYCFQQGITWDEYWRNVPKKKRLAKLKTVLESFAPIMAELYEKKIVHADFKPSNILIDEGEIPKVKLIDFGMCFQLNQPLDRTILFSLGYSAPEVILERYAMVNQTTDYYSLGILIWQLFEERLPFHHPNPGISTNLQIALPLPEGNDVPKGLHPILKRMCNKPSFKLPPNQLPAELIDALLLAAQNERYSDFEEILASVKALPDQTTWLSALKQIFTKS